MDKVIKIILLSIICLVVVILTGLKFCWLQVSSVRDMKHNAAIINATEPLPENFLLVWDKLYPGSRSYSMNRQLLSELTIGYKDCKCDEIGYLSWNNRNYKFNIDPEKIPSRGGYRMFGYGLEYYSTPEKCFDFWMNNDILWKTDYLKSLNELSVITLGKNIEELDESEIIELIAYRKLEYRAIRDREAFQNKVIDLQNRLNQ